ncbi:MAG: undecaprenyldiphospho-muramoylpentapeptide beta-N-acetylglucosaminyltransferase [Spirochaetes bacterium]|nr:undecaprenyldiphospho-muramoylpentapeptide beta-N-acetylglucosaminyltransferase [Spirochaetota bacterium]
MKKSRNCIAVSGGGTGGHIIPLLAVIEELNKIWDGKIIWIGSASPMDRLILDFGGIKYYRIPAGKLRRYFSFKNITDAVKIIMGIIVSFIILLKEKPQLLFSKGGYVSVPPVLAASLLRIPSITHESDIDPGLATRINARFSEKILISTEETAKYFGESLSKKLIVTGNPVRSSILHGSRERGKKNLPCSGDRKILFVMGGSQGAHYINTLIESIAEDLSKKYCIIHQTGIKDFRPGRLKNYYTMKYINEELPDILAASDLVICRAGANTLWELSACKKASVLIPLPLSGSRGDQIRNAEIFKKAHAAVVLDQDNLTSKKLLEIITNLLDNEDKLIVMRKNAGKLFKEDSARLIAEIILRNIQINGE